jgi:hypothetical protein
MTARSIRRLAERRAKKLAGKAAQQSTPTTTLETEALAETKPESPVPAIIPAAAANTNLTSNASPLTGQLTLLPTTDAAPYDQLLRDYQNELQPVCLQESEAVQTMAETIWRTRRLRALENAIFAQGRVEFAVQFAEHNPAIRDSLIDVHTFLTYEKQLRGLQLQESRLERRADKARAELRLLQVERQKREQAEQERQKRERETAKTATTPKSPQQPAAPVGFEFSNAEIDAYLNQRPTTAAPAPQLPNPQTNAKAA